MSKLIGQNWTGVKKKLDTFLTLFRQVSNFGIVVFGVYTGGVAVYGVYIGGFSKIGCFLDSF